LVDARSSRRADGGGPSRSQKEPHRRAESCSGVETGGIQRIVIRRPVKKVNPYRVGLAGESMGAAIALQVAAHQPRIRAVWADSPFASLRRITEEFCRQATGLPGAVLNPVLWTAIQVANYRGKFDIHSVDPLALAAQIKCPVYLVHGTADQLIATSHSESIHGALGGEKELWFVEGARHARSARHAKKDYSERLIRFFSERLRA
jgi:fermentation-respiration switch protein FrsA (DUF1100 family)